MHSTTPWNSAHTKTSMCFMSLLLGYKSSSVSCFLNTEIIQQMIKKGNPQNSYKSTPWDYLDHSATCGKMVWAECWILEVLDERIKAKKGGKHPNLINLEVKRSPSVGVNLCLFLVSLSFPTLKMNKFPSICYRISLTVIQKSSLISKYFCVWIAMRLMTRFLIHSTHFIA